MGVSWRSFVRLRHVFIFLQSSEPVNFFFIIVVVFFFLLLLISAVQIGHLGATEQYMIITGILFFFTLLYGYLQELVSIHIFAREFGLFVTLLQVLSIVRPDANSQPPLPIRPHLLLPLYHGALPMLRQFVGYSAFAFVQWVARDARGKRLPFAQSAVLAVLQVPPPPNAPCLNAVLARRACTSPR